MFNWIFFQSLKIEPSLIGHIVLALAFVGQDRRETALWAFYLAFRDCDRSENSDLLLKVCTDSVRSSLRFELSFTQSILLYVSGEHDDAISRVRGLIRPEDDHTTYCCAQVRAYSDSELWKLPLIFLIAEYVQYTYLYILYNSMQQDNLLMQQE